MKVTSNTSIAPFPEIPEEEEVQPLPEPPLPEPLPEPPLPEPMCFTLPPTPPLPETAPVTELATVLLAAFTIGIGMGILVRSAFSHRAVEA